MNPYRPQYTSHQDRMVRDGRKALVERWRGESFKYNQKRNYGVRYQHEHMEDDEVEDVILVHSTSPTMTAAWERELRTLQFRVEYGDGQFTVYVPHRHYLRRTLPCSVDFACVVAVLLQLLLCAIFVAMAFSLR